MKINYSKENNINFEALYMPNKKTLAQKIGAYSANQVESVRGLLERMATDVDIYISPKKATKHEGSGLLVKVTEKIKNPLRRLFYGSDFGYVTEFAKFSECFFDEKPMSDLLLKTVIEAKEKFLKFNMNEKYSKIS